MDPYSYVVRKIGIPDSYYLWCIDAASSSLKRLDHQLFLRDRNIGMIREG